MKEFSFPFYCMYKNGNSYFKIESKKKFIELQTIGSFVMKHEIEAKQYPEMLRIQDMLELREGTWVEITEEDYNKQLKLVNSTK